MNADRDTPWATRVVVRDPTGNIPGWFLAPDRYAPDQECVVELVEPENGQDYLRWRPVEYADVFIEDWKDETLYGALTPGPTLCEN